MAQGASQSVEDAFVLARCLAADRDGPQRAIGVYAARRRERTAAIQTASRDAGRMMHLTDPADVEARNARLRADPDAAAARFDWIWSHDVVTATADGKHASSISAVPHVG
jgi:salicylate hydroxylase